MCVFMCVCVQEGAVCCCCLEELCCRVPGRWQPADWGELNCRALGPGINQSSNSEFHSTCIKILLENFLENGPKGCSENLTLKGY